MSAKIILYDRENYKQERENLLPDSFYDVLESEKSLDFRGIFKRANISFLNYP